MIAARLIRTALRSHSVFPTVRQAPGDTVEAMANALQKYESMAIGINTIAHARGWLDNENDWTSPRAFHACMDAFDSFMRPDGLNFVCADGSRLEADEFGMWAA